MELFTVLALYTGLGLALLGAAVFLVGSILQIGRASCRERV